MEDYVLNRLDELQEEIEELRGELAKERSKRTEVEQELGRLKGFTGYNTWGRHSTHTDTHSDLAGHQVDLLKRVKHLEKDDRVEDSRRLEGEPNPCR